MAFQDQQQSGQTQEFFEVLSRRKWQILLPTFFFLTIGIAWAELVPRKYDTKTVLELRDMPLPMMGEGMDPKVVNRDVVNAPLQLKARSRVQAVIEYLQWDDFMSISDRQLKTEYVQRVVDNLKVVIGGGGKDNPSSFLTIQFADTNPERAEQFVNRLRDDYVTSVVERVRNRAREERDKLQDIVEDKNTQYQNTEAQLADLKRTFQLVYTPDRGGRATAREEDPSSSQLAGAQAQLDTSRRELQAAQALADDLRRRYQEQPDQRQQVKRESNDALQAQIAEVEANILLEKQKQSGLRAAHSVYKKAEAEIARLEGLRKDFAEQMSAGVTEIELVDNPLRSELYNELADAETQIVSLQANVNSLTTEIEALKVRRDLNLEAQRKINELDNLTAQNQEAYNKAYQAYQDQRTFVDLISGAEGNPFTVMEVAEAPRLPTSPNPWIIRILSLLIGLGIGLGTALASEFGRSGYRTIQDAGRGLAVPVLGAINKIVTRGESRKRVVQRLTIGVSSALLIGMILWITWAWKERPDLLDPGLIQSIEELRTQFR